MNLQVSGIFAGESQKQEKILHVKYRFSDGMSYILTDQLSPLEQKLLEYVVVRSFERAQLLHF